MKEQELKREVRLLRKHLRLLCDRVRACVRSLDLEMEMPPSESRGKRIAAISNELEMSRDEARHFGLGEPL